MSKNVYFKEIAYGEVFCRNGKYYLKTTPSVLTPEFKGNCVDFNGGRHWEFYPNMEVTKIGQLVFEEKGRK